MTQPGPRDAACRFLHEAARTHPILFPRPVDQRGLDDRDRRLAEAIVRTALSRWGTLVALIDHALDRPWPNVDDRVQGALLAGAAQLFLLERIPDHAVVAETVEWAKRNCKRRGATGVVNAVLRQLIELRGRKLESVEAGARDRLLLSDGSGWELHAKVFDEDPIVRLAQQSGHDIAMVQRWWTEHGERTATMLAIHGLCDPPIILHGADADPALTAHDEAGYHFLQGNGDPLIDVLTRHPESLVQDPATSEAVRRTIGLSPKIILDYCAGRGTKSRQLAAIHPEARIIATDIDQVRFDSLEQLAAKHDRITAVEPDEARAMFGEIDLLVLDVPCSNTGVLPRRPEARIRFSPAMLKNLVGLQRQIVADTIPCLTPVAHVLYATCSLEPEENQDMPAWLAKWHDWDLVDQVQTLPRGVPGDNPAGYRDGGYAALLRAH